MGGNGGDNAHNNQFGGGSKGPTGGVNGVAGSGGGNSGNGWTTTTDPGGWTVHHYTGAGGKTSSQGNGGGNSNSGAAPGSVNVNLSLFPEAQASVAAGMSMNISVIDGLWGFTFLKSKTVTSTIESALSRLMGLAAETAPLAGRFAGVVVGSLLPGTIAKDDPAYMGPIQDRIVQALLAEKVTDIAPEALTLSGNVPVNVRIRDIVKDEKQHIAVVRPGKTQPAEQVQVIEAIATPRKDVWQVTLISGMPPIHIHLSDQSQAAVSNPSRIITNVIDDAPANVTPSGGGNTHDAIVRFPTDAQQKPIYISLIDVIPATSLKYISQLAEKQKAEWLLASQLDMLNSALPRIQRPDYKLPDFTDDENALFRQDSYAAQLALIKLFEISHVKAGADSLEAEAVVARAKGEGDKAARLLQQAKDLRNSVPAMEIQLSTLRDEAAKVHEQYEIMYEAATKRFFQQRAEANQRAIEAYRQQRKEEMENYLKEAMDAANIKSAEQLKKEIESNFLAINIPLTDLLRRDIKEFLSTIDIAAREVIVPAITITKRPIPDITFPAIPTPGITDSKLELTPGITINPIPFPEVTEPKPQIIIPPFNIPQPPSLQPQKSLAERQNWAHFQLAKPGTVVLRGFSSAVSPSRSPLSFAGHENGSVTFAGEAAVQLWQRVTEVRQALQQISQSVPVAAMLTGISREESDISTVMLAGEVLDLPPEATLRQGRDTVELFLTAQLVHRENQLSVALIRHPQPVAVPVIHLSMWPDEDTGFYSYTLMDDAGIRVPVLITPDKAPGTEPLSLEVPEIPEAIIHTGNHSGNQPAPIIETFPTAEDTGYRDLILIPPVASGLKPIYIMFDDPRNLPGEVTGIGQEVSGNWLEPASKNDGVPVPAQIADKLRWQKFSNFDSFRKAFWTEVGMDPDLSKQFKAGNLGNLRAGNAPSPNESEHVGRRIKYELHHVKPIKDKGAVYDVDNIRIVTPKRHIEIHEKSK
ncbi:colicin-like bacteriocin tRNase domain-containing protein [Pantoea sp.]|uniref:colicin-like bacteriocin tRNase domain-containing protein n=1 Tax=Pantoea sp. TaxID=69393 RepID=UPI0028AE3720|nr:colicin-like bacteriocin tRNase domain-containing protein [Pantoea sp.]